MNNRYKWTTNKADIPQAVFDFIVNWKKGNTEFEAEFKLANPNEDFKGSCTGDPNLPTRQLIMAGSKEKEWIIIYHHGQGRVSNFKLLHIDIQSEANISMLYYGMTPKLYRIFRDKNFKNLNKTILRGFKYSELCILKSNSDYCQSSDSF